MRTIYDNARIETFHIADTTFWPFICFIYRFKHNPLFKGNNLTLILSIASRTMKYIKFLFLLLSIAVVSEVVSYTSGASPAYTGAISEGNCTSCHSSYSLVTSGTQWNRIRMRSNIPSTGYLPDSTYTITITYAESGISKFGFQLTALDTTNLAAGTFSTSDTRTSTSSTSVGGKTRYYIGQTTTGSARVATDSTAWTFKWKAPSTNVGKVKFYTTVNATNNNGSDNGDYIYKKDFTITPSTLLSVASAKIADPVTCSNGTKFSGSATNNPTAYLWEEKNATGPNTTLSTQQNPTIALSAGKHTILFTATNAYGKSNTVTLLTTFFSSPPKATTTPKGTSTLCAGDSIKVTVSGLNPSLFKQKWLHNNSTKTTIFLKDTGSYQNLATSLEGCSTPTDPIKILINPRPIANVSLFQPKSAYCINSPVKWNAKLNKGDSVSVTAATGPFSSDSIITTLARTSNSREKFWIKGSNGCVSTPISVSYTAIDSSSAPMLSSIDSQLTQVIFKWKSNPLAIQYSCSKDSGKTWSLSDNGGLDTQFVVATPADKSPVSLWVRYTVNSDCGISPTAKFSATTKSCTPIAYTANWKSNPICKGSTSIAVLGNLPGRYHVWMDGVAKGQTSEFNIPISSMVGKVTFKVLDSAQLVCGSTEKNLSWSAESISRDQLIHSLDTAKPNANCSKFVWVIYDCDASSVSKLWVVQNSKRVQQLSNPDYGQFMATINSGDSLWLEGASSGGCLAQSAKAVVTIVPKPNASFTYTQNGPNFTFTPADTVGEHLWYIQTGAGWLSYNKKPTVNLQAYSNQTVRVLHDLTQGGDSCFSQSYLDINLGELSTGSKTISQIRVSPNPIKQGGELSISLPTKWTHAQVIDATGRVVKQLKSDETNQSTIDWMFAKGMYQLRLFNGTESLGQIRILTAD
jgi:hypothetical protein